MVGACISVLRPQFKRKEQMMLCNVLVNTMSILNYTLIGRVGSAIFLCMVAIVQSFVSIRHERKETAVGGFEAVLFFVLYVGLGFYGLISSEGFTWAVTGHNLLELLPIFGALMLMFSVFAKGEQRTRMFLLANAAAWIVYNILVGATSVFSSSASFISTSIALWKNRKNLQK
ncbi:MAG: YgjV family protein [Oscillospiraceae bacterium]|nr:YgjV family protein [Oscillospiraceae bacterium]